VEYQLTSNAQKHTNPEVTILLPAFNEEKGIKDTVSKIKELYPDFEVLVVDDGSTDNTMQEAMTAGANVWPHPYNIGNGAAIKSGLRSASGNWVLMMDADGQHDPADIRKLLEYKDQYEMVVGARNREGQASWHRSIANGFYNRFASYVTKFKVEDLTSGFRLVKKSTVSSFIYLLPNTFSYPSTLTMAYLRCGLSVKYIPIQTRKRKGSSKIKLVQDGARFFLIITKIATLFSPFRVFLPVSAAFFLTGLGYYMYTFITAHRFSNMSALLFSTSVIVFMIGLVSEQISQARYDRTT
jgi:glycosyltransferase involved in cell wall biosynthesis